MKRIPTTLGALQENDIFYLPSDKDKKPYRCLGWHKPYSYSPGIKWMRQYVPSRLKEPYPKALICTATGNRAVVKIEH